MAYLVTGAAGFIGFHLCKRLILAGEKVYGFDNLNDYYELKLKEDRLRHLKTLAYSVLKFVLFGNCWLYLCLLHTQKHYLHLQLNLLLDCRILDMTQ